MQQVFTRAVDTGIKEGGLFIYFSKEGIDGDSTEGGVKVPSLDNRMAKSPKRLDLFLLPGYRFDISPSISFPVNPDWKLALLLGPHLLAFFRGLWAKDSWGLLHTLLVVLLYQPYFPRAYYMPDTVLSLVQTITQVILIAIFRVSIVKISHL